MALQHTLIDPASLSSEARRALGPGPAKMMAARGLAPLANPADLLTVLYQLAIDADASIAASAKKTAGELPEAILRSGLVDDALEARVLDFFSGLFKAARSELLEVIVLSRSTADETIAQIVSRSSAKLADLVAQNEERLLRHPGIIAALYSNASARMSTVDRAVELAIRSGVKVDAIPAWDELTAAVLQSGKRGESAEEPDADAADRLFRQAAGASEEGGEIVEVEEAKEIPISQMSVSMKVRLAQIGNATARAQLIRDPSRLVAMATIKSPSMKDNEVVKFAGNNSLHEDVIGYIARQREWTKLYAIKYSLVNNPKCPVALSMRLMPHLREKDVRMLAKSKNIPTALNAKARQLVANRSGR